MVSSQRCEEQNQTANLAGWSSDRFLANLVPNGLVERWSICYLGMYTICRNNIMRFDATNIFPKAVGDIPFICGANTTKAKTGSVDDGRAARSILDNHLFTGNR